MHKKTTEDKRKEDFAQELLPDNCQLNLNDFALFLSVMKVKAAPDLPLEDGTKKIFLNMTSLNGSAEVVSLLQYMKNTTLENPDIIVKDERILDLDRIVNEVRQSEEWEAVRMNILEIGMEKGRELGIEEGMKEGRKKGMKEGIEKATEMLLDMEIPEEEIKYKISGKYNIPQEEVEIMLKKIVQS